MIRILAIAAVLAALCATGSNAADLSASRTRLAALTFSAQGDRPVTPRPGVMRAACASENVRCGNPGDEDCCSGLTCDHPTGSTGICR